MSEDKDQEWVHNPDAPIMLSGKAFNELCVRQKCDASPNIVKEAGKIVMDKPLFSPVKFMTHDVTVYLYLLQLCSTSKFTITSAYDVGKYLHYTLRDKGAYRECQKASASIRRLRKAGYLLQFPSYHKGKFIPLVRMHDGKTYDSSTGFQYFCNSADRQKAFSLWGTEPVRKPDPTSIF
jgi:hypothetical protein